MCSDVSRGDLVAALVRIEESLAIRRMLGNKLGIAESLGNLGAVVNLKDALNLSMSVRT
jgi:hypothetical protein